MMSVTAPPRSQEPGARRNDISWLLAPGFWLLPVRGAILWQAGDRWPLDVAELFDLHMEVVPLVLDELHAGVDLGQQVQTVTLLQSLHGDLEDGERHRTERRQRLVAMHSPLEVDLPNRLQAELLEHVDQQAGLHSVAGEKRQLLQHLAATGLFAG